MCPEFSHSSTSTLVFCWHGQRARWLLEVGESCRRLVTSSPRVVDRHGRLWLPGAAASDDASDGGSAVGLLCCQVIVGAASDADVGGIIGAPHAARDDVVVLEPGSASAADSVGAVPGALEAVAFEHGAADFVGQVRAGRCG